VVSDGGGNEAGIDAYAPLYAVVSHEMDAVNCVGRVGGLDAFETGVLPLQWSADYSYFIAWT